MTATRTIEPTELTTGSTTTWTRNFSDYPATEWTLQYRFRGPDEPFNIDAEQNAENLEKFDVTIDPADTEDIETAGRYTWEAWLTNIADTTLIVKAASGRVQISIGFDADDEDPVETRSLAKQIVDSIDAAVLAFSTSDVQEYEISTPAGTRRVRRSDKQWFMALRDKYAAIVTAQAARERMINGKSYLPRMGVRFTDG